MCTIIEVQVLMDREELFLKYMDQIYRMAFFMLSNTHDAEDAVQETYVRMLVKKPKFADEEHSHLAARRQRQQRALVFQQHIRSMSLRRFLLRLIHSKNGNCYMRFPGCEANQRRF